MAEEKGVSYCTPQSRGENASPATASKGGGKIVVRLGQAPNTLVYSGDGDTTLLQENTKNCKRQALKGNRRLWCGLPAGLSAKCNPKKGLEKVLLYQEITGDLYGKPQSSSKGGQGWGLR